MTFLNSSEPQKKIWKEDPGRENIIDEVLDVLAKEDEVRIDGFLKSKHPQKTCGLTYEDRRDLIKFMISQDLITPINSGNACSDYKFSEMGESIYNNGGWLKLQENEKEIVNLEKSKLKYDAKLSRLQVKTFWWIFAIALIGGILGIASFFMQVLK